MRMPGYGQMRRAPAQQNSAEGAAAVHRIQPTRDHAPAADALAARMNQSPRSQRRSILLILVMTAAGFGLTLQVFYPGVMTEDARYVYEDIAKDFLGDWQSPVMTVLWSLIDPIAPGSGSMFLLIVTFYWLAFGLLAITIARQSVWLAFTLLLLAMSPSAFVVLGIIWRDVLFASTWLLSAALCFAFADRNTKIRMPIQVMALCLLALGVLLRPNAIIAAPVLGAYIAWPAQFLWKRAAIIFVPAALGFFALVQVVYYGVLGATRQNPLQSIMVFDLGGISHFAGQNQFPVRWTASQTALVTAGCYQPTDWGIYWNYGACDFVMKKLEGEKLFGSQTIVDAWRRAIVSHPGAYLQHRVSLMWNFLAGANFTLWTQDLDDPSKFALPDRSSFTTLRKMHDVLKTTPLFRAGTWLVICVAVCLFGWRRRNTSSGAFAIGVCGSAAVYLLTFFAVGVASDFRYAYWAVLASIAGSVAFAMRPLEHSAPRGSHATAAGG
jgi:hypothetical protein